MAKMTVKVPEKFVMKGKLLGEPQEERDDDIRLRMKRAVRADPLHAPDEPIVVHFRSWDDPKARIELEAPNAARLILRRELATVGEAKERLMENFQQQTTNRLELVFSGKRLGSDDSLLCDYGIIPGSTCYVRVRPQQPPQGLRASET